MTGMLTIQRWYLTTTFLGLLDYDAPSDFSAQNVLAGCAGQALGVWRASLRDELTIVAHFVAIVACADLLGFLQATFAVLGFLGWDSGERSFGSRGLGLTGLRGAFGSLTRLGLGLGLGFRGLRVGLGLRIRLRAGLGW